MMGRRKRDQGKLFYEFRLDDRIPESHLLRRMNVFGTLALSDLHKELAAHYSEVGGPSVDLELMCRHCRYRQRETGPTGARNQSVQTKSPIDIIPSDKTSARTPPRSR
jgi:hypothetical protein